VTDPPPVHTHRISIHYPFTILAHMSFCLSNAVHGQNINLPVCVYVTLSDNLPTGQTPQRIFTVDSLKDVDLCKDVPFGGFNDE